MIDSNCFIFQGPPHRKTFSWALKLGEHESVGTAASKKIAKALAATQLMESLPEELKVISVARWLESNF